MLSYDDYGLVACPSPACTLNALVIEETASHGVIHRIIECPLHGQSRDEFDYVEEPDRDE